MKDTKPFSHEWLIPSRHTTQALGGPIQLICEAARLMRTPERLRDVPPGDQSQVQETGFITCDYTIPLHTSGTKYRDNMENSKPCLMFASELSGVYCTCGGTSF